MLHVLYLTYMPIHTYYISTQHVRYNIHAYYIPMHTNEHANASCVCMCMVAYVMCVCVCVCVCVCIIRLHTCILCTSIWHTRAAAKPQKVNPCFQKFHPCFQNQNHKTPKLGHPYRGVSGRVLEWSLRKLVPCLCQRFRLGHTDDTYGSHTYDKRFTYIYTNKSVTYI
jgi:hypothetical protein